MAEDGLSDDGPVVVANVQRVRKGGKIHLYFRKGDYREGPLKSPDHTQELKDEVAAIVARLAGVQAASVPKPGTIGGMLKAYNRSADAFLSLARSTQALYQDIIDELVADCGDMTLKEVDRSWIVEMRDVWAVRGHRVANLRLQVLKNALDPAVDDGRIATDPFARVKKARTPRGKGEAHPAWEDHEIDAAIDEAIRRDKPGLARAIGLGRWGGFRRGTICNVPVHARIDGFDERGDPCKRLHWITEKRLVLCDKREDPRLAALLARTPNKALTIAYNADGHPWKERQLNQALDRLMDALAKAGKVRQAVTAKGEAYCPLTIHGLRHARGVELAQAGASDAEIMSQLEHATDRQAKIYRRQADRRKLADAGQDRVDNVVKLRAKRAAPKAAANSPGT